MRVGCIGLGAMGAPMAVNLVKAGHAVRGFDLRAGAVDALVATGGGAASSAADAARDAELLWLMVVTGEQAEAVLFQDGAAAAALNRGAIVGLGCTQPPALAARTAARLRAIGLHTLDAPVSGGTKGAIAGTLTIMCAGDEAVLQRARPVLDVLGRRVFDCGREPGLGSTAKMLNQLLCGVNLAAAAEAMHLAERAGVAKAMLHEIVGASSGNSWMWEDRGPRIMQDDPSVTSAVDIFVKDLGIVLDEARAHGADVPLAAAAMRMFAAASGLGHGSADDSQVIRAYRAVETPARKE